mgnify:CR=1 FL=1
MRTTSDFEEDLALICNALQEDGTRLNKTQAVQMAVARIANTYRSAWDYGDVQDGTAPVLLSYRYRMDNGDPSWVPSVPHLNIIERDIT